MKSAYFVFLALRRTTLKSTHFVFLALLLLASCSHPSYKLQPSAPAPAQPPLAAPAEALPAPKTPLPAPPDYRMGPGDEFELVETRLAALNRHYILAPDGGVVVPLLGSYNLAGMTPEEAMRLLQKDLEKNYRDPELSLILSVCKNYRICIFGEVVSPGEYAFERKVDLLMLLARAGGLRKPDTPCLAVVNRGEGEIYEVDLDTLLREGRSELSIPLHPGDRVHVRMTSERGVHLMGEVKSPGYYPIESGMTVLRAINLAGGMTESAASNDISLIHPRGLGEAELASVDLSGVENGRLGGGLLPLMAGDIVYVPITGLGKFNYYLRQITPGLNMIVLGEALNRTGR